jgi:diadenosine tetraphosphate (Ap4A) HIT family hydrolase
MIPSAADARKKFKSTGSGCLFCELPNDRIVHDSKNFMTIHDKYPVTEGHALIIPKRHVESAMDLTEAEFTELYSEMLRIKAYLHSKYENINGFNLGFNVGEAAGQTVMHAHFHVIPRRKGDMKEPRGGIRGAIPEKQKY